ncbi:hypothetical protein EJ06DRAFT_580663 [Trichodelitschia bisporula]|uniref:Tetratricopeptide SHNi-TPR domain-containing protein n=1 Tax=Trichodelitschia bisporula TaxID=703511 RepID=A0A6G1I2C0_9PEZI|nr:hypothetical protein EJ06DRAFT_580663 [Trichodelitschia bisporula]
MAEETPKSPSLVPSEIMEAADVDNASKSSSKFDQIVHAANMQYALKKYSEAADLYSTATVLQAETNGEMDPANADLLYLYGRCLYKVAVAKSDVLGGPAATESKKKEDIEAAAGASAAAAAPDVAKQPFFEFTGDENWDTESDEEDKGDDGDKGEEEQEDDLGSAFEVLELARVLFEKQLKQLADTPIDESKGPIDVSNGTTDTDKKGKGKSVAAPSHELKRIKTSLADVRDLLAEIGLENERFSDAVVDAQAALELKLQLNPPESALIAEAHYKVSLALEFASVNVTREKEGTEAVVSEDVDTEMRAESARHMELALESCRLRLEKEEREFKELGDKSKVTKDDILEMKEVIEDMELRLADLHAPPVKVADINNPASSADSAVPADITELFKRALAGAAAPAPASAVDDAKPATDLTGLVRKKGKPAAKDGEKLAVPKEGGSSAPRAASEKRKLDYVEEKDETEGKGKKARH